MKNSNYAVGLVYMGLCAVAIAASRPAPDFDPSTIHYPVDPLPAEAPSPDPAPAPSNAAEWFSQIKPYCNTVEVETALAGHPPAPETTQGIGYKAACLALGGKIDRARETIESLAGDARWQAAGVVFEVAHPVADAGDDRSAGPIMALVADFWPTHYMALYHAGMSEFALGDQPAAIRHLTAFLHQYQAEDGWKSSARGALAKMGIEAP